MFLCSELYEAKVWNEDEKYWSPMIILDSKIHVYIGDIVTSKSTCTSWKCGKVIKFVEVLQINSAVNNVIVSANK